MATWALFVEMSPYLLLGFVVAGFCGQMIPRVVIERHLARGGWMAVVKAVIVGVPMPLCSCGVIPVAAKLNQQGASKGSVAAFVSTTPQTGVDSLLVTYSLLGGVFTAIRVLANVIGGVIAGMVVHAITRNDAAQPQVAASVGTCCSDTKPEPTASTCCQTACEASTNGPTQNAASDKSKARPPWLRQALLALHDGLVQLPRDIGKWLVAGILIGGLISALVPTNALEQLREMPSLTYLAITLIALPTYVCATGSIPMAFALIQAGLSPGAAMVFLIAGPATNMATFTTLVGIIGRNATLAYTAVLICSAWVMGFLMDTLIGHQQWLQATTHAHSDPSWWHLASAIFLASLLGYALWPRKHR